MKGMKGMKEEGIAMMNPPAARFVPAKIRCFFIPFIPFIPATSQYP
jgi:hypothetical protein